MSRRISSIALVFAWICANGAIWDVVQVVAWAKMYHAYSQVMSVGDALALTFDGSRPCELCSVSQAAKDAAREETPGEQDVGGGERALFVCEDFVTVVPHPPAATWSDGRVMANALVETDVPVPPPRA